MRLSFLTLAGLAFLATPVFAQGAWPVTHKWSDQARPNDPTSGSYGYEYGAASIAITSSEMVAGSKYDCADFAVTELVEYASRNGLEVTWTVPVDDGWTTFKNVSSTDAQFHSEAQFASWSRGWTNAKMVAKLNTYPIAATDARSGDVVMMSWAQLGADDPFGMDASGKPADVWHTYVIGEPGKLLFYGNDDGPGQPLPITATMQTERLDEAAGRGTYGPCVYQGSPRRWNILNGMVIPPATPLQNVPTVEAPETATVNVATLNVRGGPSTGDAVLSLAHKGDTLSVEGTSPDGQWVRVRKPDGTVAYVSSAYVSVASSDPPFQIITDNGLLANRFPHPPATPGITGGLTAPTPNNP
jgi:hypothetical protein